MHLRLHQANSMAGYGSNNVDPRQPSQPSANDVDKVFAEYELYSWRGEVKKFAPRLKPTEPNLQNLSGAVQKSHRLSSSNPFSASNPRRENSLIDQQPPGIKAHDAKSDLAVSEKSSAPPNDVAKMGNSGCINQLSIDLDDQLFVGLRLLLDTNQQQRARLLRAGAIFSLWTVAIGALLALGCSFFYR